MNDCCTIPHPLQREGTTQNQRMPEGLRKGFFVPDARSSEEVLEQVARFATLLRYYDSGMQEWGRWDAFFDYLYDYKNQKLRIEHLEELSLRGDVPPHLGLLLAFLKNFDALRHQMNHFTQRHVSFYYEEILQLKKRAAQPDKVLLLATLEKKFAQAFIAANTLFDAGKDEQGIAFNYRSTRDVTPRNIEILHHKSMLVSHENSGKISNIQSSENATLENLLPDKSKSGWHPFGSTQNKAATLGFALSSPTLLAQCGKRRISIEIEGTLTLPRNDLTAFYTGPEGWIEATIDTQPGGGDNLSSKASRYLLIKINAASPAVVAYQAKVHGNGFSTVSPVLKIILKPGIGFGNALQVLSSIKKVAIKKIRVQCSAVNVFTLSGENGVLDPSKSFKPFGSFPIKNKSYFILGSKEIFNKYLRSFHVAMNWKAAPGNPSKFYESYFDYLTNAAADNSMSKEAKAAFKTQWATFDQGNVPGKMEVLSGGQWQKVAEDNPVNYSTKSKNQYNTFHLSNQIEDLFEVGKEDIYSATQKWGFAKITLGFDFGHRIFPNAVAYTAMNNALNKVNNPLPPAPYTPEFNNLQLEYTAEGDPLTEPEHQFYKIHPFGTEPLINPEQNIVEASYLANGYLYIGVSGFSEPGNLHLFIQRLAGSENIDVIITEPIQYAYLNGNVWADFLPYEIITDTTFGFSGSGFLTFAIPETALLTNTLMGENLLWIRIAASSEAMAYAHIYNVYTNAIEAELHMADSAASWLSTALPLGTISKAAAKITGVKKIEQPIPSYGGAAAEEETAFHTRVSERLRHKNRAVNIWDYERIILQEFPQVYKAKCLSHSDAECMYEAGKVLCVVIPKAHQLLPESRLKPRLSSAFLQEATLLLGELNSPFAQVQVVNALFEEVTIKCRVKMNKGFDASYYMLQLNADLQNFICPWLNNEDVSPTFSGTLYTSAIINFIEERPYINVVVHFEAFVLRQDGQLSPWKEAVQGSNERVILTSVPQHLIETTVLC